MITLCFVGDFCLAGRSLPGTGPASPMCDRCREAIAQADLAVANLECCLVENESQSDGFTAVPVTQCGAAADSGFDVYCLANNHIMDCGEESLQFARRYLERAGIETFGAADDIAGANAPLILSRQDKRVAIFGVTDATHYRARNGRGGVSPLQPRRLKKAVKKVREDADLVVVCIHSDLEFTNYPAPWKVRLSRQLARAGADLIIHHHSHALQGIEMYDGSLIACSLGNFVFPVHGRKYMENRDGTVDESVILKIDVTFAEDGQKDIAHSLLPVVIGDDNVTVMAEGERADSILRNMSQYSDALDDSRFLRRHYFRRCREEFRRFVKGTYYALRKDGVRKAWDYVGVHFRTAMHRNWMRGYLTLGHF